MAPSPPQGQPMALTAPLLSRGPGMSLLWPVINTVSQLLRHVHAMLMRSARSPIHVSDSEPESEWKREREEAMVHQRIRHCNAVAASPSPEAASPERSGFHSPGAPATRCVYRSRNRADGAVAIEAHTLHSSDEDDQYRVGLTPPKHHASTRITATSSSEVPKRRRPSRPQWNDKDSEFPESRREYYRRVRRWHGTFESYQAERTTRIANGPVANGPVAIESPP